MFMIIILVFKMDINCILMKYYFNVFNHNSWHFMDIICILMKYHFNVPISICVLQMDNNCILMKYYFHVYDHNSCISNGHYLHFNEILF